MVTASNKWRNTLTIKNLFQDKTTPELIVVLCDSIIRQLKTIWDRESSGNLKDDEKEYIAEGIEELTDHFLFLKELANGTIKKEEWLDFSFDGNYERLFNNYMNELYDLGDTKVTNNLDVSEKFIWIN